MDVWGYSTRHVLGKEPKGGTGIAEYIAPAGGHERLLGPSGPALSELGAHQLGHEVQLGRPCIPDLNGVEAGALD